MIESERQNIKNNFSKCCTENLSKEIFMVDPELKTIPWKYKIKDLNSETIIGSFYKKNCCLVNCKWVIF